MEFIVLAFATYGLASAITTTDGPFSVFYKLRHMKYSKMFECFPCCAVWVGLLLALIAAPDIGTWFMFGIGAAGASMFLDELADRW